MEIEDDLQRAIFQLTKPSEAHDMKISIEKIKTVAFNGKDAMRSKSIINGNIEQVNTFRFRYLRNKFCTKE